MCTVIVQVPESASESVRLLAVRDEDPLRAWDPPGAWWPELPGVIGVRDRRAGGAWLATRDNGLSVLLNRAESTHSHLPATSGLLSRGAIVLDDVTGTPVPDPPQTASFNLISARPGTATVTSWDGETLQHLNLEPGMHMVAHHDADDPRSARIEKWLPEFTKLTSLGSDWRTGWVDLLARTTKLPVSDDRAIIRDNHTHGYPTASLLVCTAEIPSDPNAHVQLESAILSGPAVWDSPVFLPAPN